jgi:hypothetical protein
MQIKDLYPDTLFTNLPSNESAEDLSLEELNVFLKFTTPFNPEWSWYVFSGDIHGDGNIRFYGFAVNEYGAELGYFMLSDLAGVFAVPDHSLKGTGEDVQNNVVFRNQGGCNE